MKKVKTTSGFVIDVDETKAADWDFVCSLVDCESPDDSVRVKASVECMRMLLGKEGTAALADHVKDENGIRNIAKMLAEFREILAQLGEKSKK